MSQVRVNTIVDANSGNTAQINGMTPTAQSLQGFRNRILNGGMRIDQRNAGASVNVTSAAQQFVTDRFQVQCATDGTLAVQQSTTAPSGFSNALLLTVSVADASLAAGQIARIRHKIEGFNVADLGFGTAGALSVTVSFWVRSSVTGTFAGYLGNSASNRTQPFTFTINSANTFEQKSVTITGDTTGTWLTNNGTGIELGITLGAGSDYNGTVGAWAAAEDYSVSGATNLLATSGATFYITGVQLEAGSVATPFERRPYGTELALCQRYFLLGPSGAAGRWNSSTAAEVAYSFRVEMRAAPTVTHLANYSAPNAGVANITVTATSISDTSNTMGTLLNLTGSGASAGGICIVRGNGAGFSAEL
jgi:hypothetical protein